jgi:hypothetical protein
VSADTAITIAGVDLRLMFRRLGYVEIDPVDIVSISFDPTTVIAGESLEMTAILGNGNYGDVSYQWYRAGVAISGATGSYYGTTAQTSDDGVTWRCDVSNSEGSDSASGSVTVYPAPYAEITGDTTVPVGGGGGKGWQFKVYSPHGLTEVMFGIVGHSTSPTQYSGTLFEGSASWSSPFGNPDVSSAPGSFTLFIQGYDNDDNYLYDSIGVTVS